MQEPLHVAEIRGRRLRFSRTPLNDGRPDFPWHVPDDLYRVMKLPRGLRRHFREHVRGAAHSRRPGRNRTQKKAARMRSGGPIRMRWNPDKPDRSSEN
jgi:hypothetical protein